MQENGLFFQEAAYQWAESFWKKAPTKEIKAIDEKSFSSLLETDFRDLGISFYESPFQKEKSPLLLLEKIDMKKGTEKILVYKLEKNSFELFKEKNKELAQLLLMQGRILYTKQLCVGEAELPVFRINI